MSADRLFLFDWDELINQDAHLWAAFFVAVVRTFALLPRRFIMHTIWLGCQFASRDGLDRDQIDGAVSQLHISAPIGVEPFFILFNAAIRRDVRESYAQLFTFYWQSGLIVHWFSLEDRQIENLLTCKSRA